jgi:hypothetical protein
VRELPLSLNNLNNLVFAPDGRLFALCYDGNVFQLVDTDGDGLEDTPAHFYRNDKNEILPSIGMCWGPGGLYIASQGRVMRLRDKGDGTAALETVTGGWVKPTEWQARISTRLASPPIRLAIFSSASAATNGTKRIASTKRREDPTTTFTASAERFLKFSPDWKKREPICTGMRFPVSLAFNAAGRFVLH